MVGKLERLTALFEGKIVRVTHTAKGLGPDKGVCLAIYAPDGENDCFRLEMDGVGLIGFNPETVTEDSVDGRLPGQAGGYRKIEVV